MDKQYRWSSWMGKKHRDPKIGEKGFTLIELLIVMGISLFGLAGLMSVYTTSSRANATVGSSAQGIEICEKSMESLRSMRIAEIETKYVPINTNGWGTLDYHNGNAFGRNNAVFERSVEAIELLQSSSLIRIKVIVRWADNGKALAASPASTHHRVSLEMVRTREEAL